MTDATVKTIVAAAFLAAGTAAFLTMMSALGRPGAAGDPGKLRKTHRAFGWLYAALFVPLAYFGADFVGELGDGMSTRGVIHVVLAETLFTLLLLKVLIARFFRGFLKSVPALGMALFALTMVIFLITAGFVFLQKALG